LPIATFRHCGQSPVATFRLYLLFCFFFLVVLSACRGVPQLVRSDRRITVKTENTSLRIHLVTEIGGTGQGAGQFLTPIDLTVDVNGLIYVADMGNSRIQVLSANGDFQYEFGHQGWRIGEFDSPTDVVVGDQLTLFCTDTGNNRVQVYQLIDSQFQLFSSPDWSVRSINWLDQPTGLDRSSNGEVYVVDHGHHRLLKFDSNGRLLFQCGRYGNGIDQFNLPTDVAIDRAGNLYVVDAGNGRIKKYDFSGNFIMQWSKQLQYPNRIAAYELVYVTDGKSVKVFTSTGAYLTEFGPFDQPSGIATLEDRYLYVTDLLRNTVSIFDLKAVSSD